MQLNDCAERKTALDITRSFIVQAPAGSGKTELLTQRFLNLLAHAVKVPEEIIAITFTRKAVAEMQDRIIHALQFAQSHPKPEDDFAATTWQLAKDALKQDQKLNWQLLTNPNRLRIQTIDALCESLTQQIPILSRFGSQPKISDDAKNLYREAVRALLENMDEKTPWHDALLQLLSHLDNSLSRVENLFIVMLGKRDQWLPYVIQAHSQTELRFMLENGLTAITADQLEKICDLFPEKLASELIELAIFAAKNLQTLEIESNILACINLCELPNQLPNSKDSWLGIAELLLTKNGSMRKKVEKNIGFPAVSSIKNKTEKIYYESMKERMKSLLAAFDAHTDFVETLHELRKTPPVQYSETQWQTLSALLKLLPIAAAQLTLSFREKGEVDFIEVTQAALRALGSFDAPTDLALSLDYQMKHILFDEFQDTSMSQFRLLELLTAGWENNDGRTLFIVGDPMQSIYRFRQAEVGLFLRARHERIGQIQLEPLTLSINFRSSQTIVDWINLHCAKMFPTIENISEGAVTYSKAFAAHQKIKDSEVKLHALINADAKTEAQQVAYLIKQHQEKFPNDTIAILVKARSHLFEILPMLRAHHLPYRAIEIDELSLRPVIQDLFALTTALLHPAGRTAWFSILRAPWCGLTLKDLQIIADTEAGTSILDNIQKKDLIKNLSADGQKRLLFFQNVIMPAMNNRRRKPLRDCIHDIWIKLKAPACYAERSSLDDAKNYFQLLEQSDVGGDIKDFTTLQEKINLLFASPDSNASERLQVMTIHRAKGLEFDAVIIPGLQHSTHSDDAQLLLWTERPRIHRENDLILAPIRAANCASDSIYDYLAYEMKKKNTFEDLRLLYVAMTRAKKHLHLVGSAETTEDGEALKNPVANSFLSTLWPLVQKDFFAKLHSKYPDHFQHLTSHNFAIEGIRRLPIQEEVTVDSGLNDMNDPIILDTDCINSNYYTAIGTVTHLILQQISLDGLDAWHGDRLKHCQASWKNLLLQFGALPHEVDAALKQVMLAVNHILADEKGRWILSKHHADQSEYRLALKNSKQVIIDRTFIDENNIRWIIDYKTTNETFDDIKTFIETAKLAHQKQVEVYADALKHFGTEKIFAGLYYPLQKIWIQWEIRNGEDKLQPVQ